MVGPLRALSSVAVRMNAHSLLASAAINIGLTLIVLVLFSVLKKQPSNAYIYYARRLSLNHRVSFDSSLSLRRFFPSFSWISRALHVSEDEMLDSCGLDALIIIRLFKFGIHFFGVCTIIGVVVLLPINCNGNDGRDHSLSSFTISNISRGSNWLWVHFSCLWFISIYGLWLLYKEYKDILLKRIQQLKINRHRPDQFNVLVRGIPLCNEHKAHGCYVNHYFSKHHPYTYYSSRILYDWRNLEELLSRTKYISREIQERRERSTPDQDVREPLLADISRMDAAEIALLEEKLRKMWDIIQKLQGEIVSEHKELPVAFVAFKCRWGATLAAQSQQSSHPLLWRTEMAPEPRDVSWRNLAIPHRLLPIYKLAVVLGAAALTIFFAIPVTAVQGIAKFEKLKKWFPPAMAVQLIPGLSSIVTGYLPSVILNSFIYIVPFAMLAMAKLSGCVSKSKQEIKACNMVFYFLVGNVFFLSLISGSLLDEIEEYLTHPRSIPSHVARPVSSQADFFVTYILADGLSAFSLEILQPGLLSLYFVQSCICCTRRKEKNTYLYSLPYFRVIPLVSLLVLIGMVYAVVSPLLLPFLVGYFCLGYVVYIHQIEDVYETVYETFGQYWPQVHRYIITAIILMQITMIGLFGLKSKPAASISTIPLLLLTLLFNEYCKIRFLPSFRHYSVQDAMENDDLDRRKGELEVNYHNASKAYYPPSLQSLNLIASGSSSGEPRDF